MQLAGNNNYIPSRGAAFPKAPFTCLCLPPRAAPPAHPTLAALVPVHVDLADLLTSLGGAAMFCPLSFSFCIMTVSTFSPNTLDLPRQRGDAGELWHWWLCREQPGTEMD